VSLPLLSICQFSLQKFRMSSNWSAFALLFINKPPQSLELVVRLHGRCLAAVTVKQSLAIV
jgi:hypothetical protein